MFRKSIIYCKKSEDLGPCWLDIPLDVQGAYVEEDELESYNIEEYKKELPPEVSEEIVNKVLEKIKNAKRPVLYAGNGIRLSNGYEVFKRVIKKLNVPVVTAWNSIDLIPSDDSLYVGHAGIRGNRARKFCNSK